MLYATTRSKTDSYTAYRTLHEDRAPDGGYYIPFRMPKFDRGLILKMKEQTFSETVSQLLNVFFSARITAWDVDCCIGKHASKVIAMDRKVLLVKLWNNPSGTYSYICEKLYQKLCGDASDREYTEWAYIAIRVSVLFGIYSQLSKNGISSFDICVNCEDFSDLMAAWYARYMGLPVGKIICACYDDSAFWDLIYRGEIVTKSPGLERLIYAALGFDETKRFLDSQQLSRTYLLQPEQLRILGDGLFVSVIGKGRPESVITSFYGSNCCLLDPDTAAAYGSLQDYRSTSGESFPTVVLWDSSPMHHITVIENATGLNRANIETFTNTI